MARLLPLLLCTGLFIAEAPAHAAAPFSVGDATPLGIGHDDAFSAGPTASTPRGTVLMVMGARSGLWAHHRGTSGRWTTTRLSATGFDVFPRAVPIEDGGLMALWIENRNQLWSRTFAADGTIGAPTLVLRDALLIFSGDSEARLWEVRYDERGTVVVLGRTATVGDISGGVLVATREPRSGFTPQQLLREPTTPPYQQEGLAISAIAGDGSVRVGWQDGYGGPWRQVARTGVGPFGPATDTTYPALVTPDGAGVDAVVPSLSALDLDRIPRTARRIGVFVDGSSAAVVIGPRIRKLCAEAPRRRCDPVQRVPGTSGVLALSPRGDGRFLIATADPDRRFDEMQELPTGGTLIPRTGGRGLELLTSVPRGVTGIDLVTVPVGRGTRPRQAPRPRPADVAFSRAGILSVRAWCTARCRLRARVAGTSGRSRVLGLGYVTPRTTRTLLNLGESGEASLRLPDGRLQRVRVTFVARGDAGRSSKTVTYRLARRERAGQTWCRVGGARVRRAARRSTAGTA